MIKKKKKKRKIYQKKLSNIWKIIKKNLTVAIMKTVSQPTQPKENCVPVVTAVWFWYSSNPTEHWRILIWEWTKKYIPKPNYLSTILKCWSTAVCVFKTHNGAKTILELPLNSYSHFLLYILNNGPMCPNQQHFFLFFFQSYTSPKIYLQFYYIFDKLLIIDRILPWTKIYQEIQIKFK